MSDARSKRLHAGSLELDYPRRPRLLPGWRLWLLGGLALGCVGLGGLYAVRGNAAFQSGPLSRPHALFKHDCGKCHTSHGSTLARLVYGDGVGSVTNEACVRCHTGAPHNPPHGGAVGRCVECHKEHRGHDALVGVPDATCVRCHGALEGVHAETKFEPKVTAFDAKNHPAFRVPKDEGTIRFNHAAHLNGSAPSLKELTCASCHEPEADGRYMKPIRYEEHCKTCHPLGANLVGDFRDEGRRGLAGAFTKSFLGRVEHPRRGQKPGVVRASLRDALTRFILDERHAAFLLADPRRPRDMPDRGGGGVSEHAFRWVNGQLGDVERAVFDGSGGCKYCHTLTPGVSGLPEVAPPKIAERWWQHATFSHKPHRMQECGECHPAGGSEKTADVLLPDQASCVRCHRPGGARADCVECHAYHGPPGRR